MYSNLYFILWQFVDKLLHISHLTLNTLYAVSLLGALVLDIWNQLLSNRRPDNTMLVEGKCCLVVCMCLLACVSATDLDSEDVENKGDYDIEEDFEETVKVSWSNVLRIENEV